MSEEAEEVQLIETPWSTGQTIVSYFGVVWVLVRVPREPRDGYMDRLDEAIGEAIEQAMEIAASRGANTLSSPALEIDPFGEFVEIRVGGSAFELRAKRLGERLGLRPTS